MRSDVPHDEEYWSTSWGRRFVLSGHEKGNHMTTRRDTQRRSARLGALLLITVAMLTAVTVFTTPEASAHSGKFEHDDIVIGDSCRETHIPNGLQDDNFIGCTPTGYVPIGSDVALCQETDDFFVDDWCTYDQARVCSSSRSSIGFNQPIRGGMCVRPALVLEKFAPGSGAALRSVTAVCVESQLVQEHAAGQNVGDLFTLDGTSYLIITGRSCSFNCDGKLGDFCPTEYDRAKVAGIGQCMAAKGIAPTTGR